MLPIKEVINLKFFEGFFCGMLTTIAGCIAFKFMFPETEKEMCDSIKKIGKNMEKDISSM